MSFAAQFFGCSNPVLVASQKGAAHRGDLWNVSLAFALPKTVEVIIFDFDGTIADTFDAVVEITNSLAEKFGYKPVGLDEIKRLKNLSSREIVKQSKIPTFKLPFLVRQIRAELEDKVHRLTPFLGIQEALVMLKCQGYQLGIVTSNSEQNVVIFLRNYNLNELFDFIYSEITLFGKAKVISRCLAEKRIGPASAIYVGDETRDIEAAKRIQIKVVAVTWGFNSKKALAKQNPDFLIDQPFELIEACKSLRLT